MKNSEAVTSTPGHRLMTVRKDIEVIEHLKRENEQLKRENAILNRALSIIETAKR